MYGSVQYVWAFTFAVVYVVVMVTGVKSSEEFAFVTEEDLSKRRRVSSPLSKGRVLASPPVTSSITTNQCSQEALNVIVFRVPRHSVLFLLLCVVEIPSQQQEG